MFGEATNLLVSLVRVENEDKLIQDLKESFGYKINLWEKLAGTSFVKVVDTYANTEGLFAVRPSVYMLEEPETKRDFLEKFQ
ncbi:MAG: hypothetical protein NZ927_06025 [Candidatus Calescibacterium sp.]|nr:hypothetical protein [Candidatus Calescibacterium sp.]MCX7734918.1 hypothetical protein [bacterium]MDW8087771.1 hypothetical protein [Candidatus Calescibacterium sp.]